MTIDDVIKECIIALYSSKVLEKTNSLVLKGGTALRVVEKITVRLSTDMDFSVSGEISNPKSYFDTIKKLLERHFKKLGFEVIDAKHKRKPARRKSDTPQFWRGWEFVFKLSSIKNRNQSSSFKRRNALIPDGSNTSTITLEISEHEYCESLQTVRVGGVQVLSYSNLVLVAEKIRAICQSHPNYPHSNTRNRARDYLDIFLLTKKHHADTFYKKLKTVLPDVFAAKDVPIELMSDIFDPDFASIQKKHFQSVRDQVGRYLEPFEFYQEQLRALIVRISV